ncbi:MAG: CapA family protein [Polyangiaceae bacterium]|nr:CapA family protein [Polyangiaceae bacterium]
MPRRWRRVLLWWLPPGIAALLLVAWVARPLWWTQPGERLAAVPRASLTLERPRQVSVLFAGDTHFGESYFTDPARPAAVVDRGYDVPLQRVRSLCESADFVVVNLETPLTHEKDSPLRSVKRWVHWGDPDKSAEALRSLGVRAAGLANNHAFDALAPGLVSTQAALARRGIASFGAGPTLADAARPLRADLGIGRHRLRLLVLGAFERKRADWQRGAYATDSGPGTYPLVAETITAQIRAMRKADPDLFIVAFPHWGENYAWRSPAQAQIGHALIDAGADIVLGHGAHLFQEIEPYRGRLIVYSLGNFVFLSPGRYKKRRMHPWSLAARLDFSEQGNELSVSASVYFLASDNSTTDYQPALLRGSAFEKAVDTLLEEGSLPEAARAELRRIAKPHRDGSVEYLRVDLGTVGGR